MKILFFTKYSRLGASSRLRSFQYIPFIEAKGHKVIISPLFDDDYVRNILDKKRAFASILKSYFNRFFVLFTIFKYDRILIEKELFPYLPSFAESLLKLLGVKYIADYDDAIFHNYDQNSNKLIRFFLSKKIDTVMKYSHGVIAGNPYLKNRAKKAGAQNIITIPTVIDTSRYVIQYNTNDDNLIIGWIGSPHTFNYLKNLETTLHKLIKTFSNIEIHIIGTKEKLKKSNLQIKYFDWAEDTEVRRLQNFDIGIMPLLDSPWAKGKCAYKLIQYMGCGIPVVASPIGMNKDIVKPGFNGFLAKDNEDWFTILSQMITKDILLKEMGANGRKTVVEKYNLQKSQQDYITFITS